MLRVTLEVAPTASSKPVEVGTLDLVRRIPGPQTTYCASMRAPVLGPIAEAEVVNYPRWQAASVFDLVLRATTRCLNDAEVLDPVPPALCCAGVSMLFVDVSHAHREHVESSGFQSIARLEVINVGTPGWGIYKVQWKETGFETVDTGHIRYAPHYFNPWLLAAYACCSVLNRPGHALDRNIFVPSRPLAPKPRTYEVEGELLVAVEELDEPARTGFRSFLAARHVKGRSVNDCVGPALCLSYYEQFIDGLGALEDVADYRSAFACEGRREG